MNRSSVRFRQAAPRLTRAFAVLTGLDRGPIHFLVSVGGSIHWSGSVADRFSEDDRSGTAWRDGRSRCGPMRGDRARRSVRLVLNWGVSSRLAGMKSEAMLRKNRHVLG